MCWRGADGCSLLTISGRLGNPRILTSRVIVIDAHAISGEIIGGKLAYYIYKKGGRGL